MSNHPRVGTDVYYYNPNIIQRVGLITGYGGRGAGPYAAKVTNNAGPGVSLVLFFPGLLPMTLDAVPFEDDAKTLDKDKGYWAFHDPLAKDRYLKARAKETADAEAAQAATAA